MYLHVTENGVITVEKFLRMDKNVESWQSICGGKFEDVEMPFLPKRIRDRYRMLVWEESRLNNCKVNLIASKLYGLEFHGHVVCGNICIVRREWDYKCGCWKYEAMESKHIREILNIVEPIREDIIEGGNCELW